MEIETDIKGGENMRRSLISSLMICVLLLITSCKDLSAVVSSSGVPAGFFSQDGS